MRAEDCHIGMRVYVPSRFFSNPAFKGQRGRVVTLHEMCVGVDFDNTVYSIIEHNSGHTCGGFARKGHGWYGSVSEIEPELKAIRPTNVIDLSDIKISFEDVFGGDEA